MERFLEGLKIAELPKKGWASRTDRPGNASSPAFPDSMRDWQLGSDSMKTNSRQFSVLAAALTVSVAAMMAPASADAPTAVEVSPNDIPFVDPCTGESDIAHFAAIQFVHGGHSNNFLFHAQRTGFTDNGYEMFAGNATFQQNRNVITAHLNDLWRREADGSMFHTFQILNVDLRNGAVRHNKFRLQCVGDEAVI